LIEELEVDYLNGGSDQEKEKLAYVVVFVLTSFLVGLRGEYTSKIFLGETKDFLDRKESHMKHKHVILSLIRRFKGDNYKSYNLVAVTTKSNSDLQIDSWLRRVLDWKDKINIVRIFYL